jgi:hypothetical protein
MRRWPAWFTHRPLAALATAGLVLCQGRAGAQQKPPASEPRLQQLVGTWTITKTTFVGADNATWVARPVAGGLAVHSVWTHGADGGRYEAQALWGYDALAREVRVFETNTLGQAVLHVGRFDDSGALVCDQRSADGATLVRRSKLTWSGDTMQMDATFYALGKETKAFATMVRRRSN